MSDYYRLNDKDEFSFYKFYLTKGIKIYQMSQNSFIRFYMTVLACLIRMAGIIMVIACISTSPLKKSCKD